MIIYDDDITEINGDPSLRGQHSSFLVVLPTEVDDGQRVEVT
jgi:hypothetical protein